MCARIKVQSVLAFISIHLLNIFFFPVHFCLLLTQDICSPILTPLPLLVLFATTFFFRG